MTAAALEYPPAGPPAGWPPRLTWLSVGPACQQRGRGKVQSCVSCGRQLATIAVDSCSRRRGQKSTESCPAVAGSKAIADHSRA